VATVAFMVHHDRPEAADLARDAAAWLQERGHEVRLLEADARLADLNRFACAPDELCPGLDVAISLGGDGTMLRTVDLVAGDEVPVIGVNLGQLGYLTEVEPSQLRMALKRFLAGSYQVEERMRLAVDVESHHGDVPPGPHPALNEVVVEKTPSGHTVRLSVSIDGEFFTTYATDGLIVATPTGSTAYAFSARGPIVSPTHAALLITPVSPHMLFDRTLVLGPSTVVRVEVLEGRRATASVDGRNLGWLGEGDAVVCTAAKHPARLIVFGTRNFLGILKAKFGLNDRY
jgi:NAD+ kinase